MSRISYLVQQTQNQLLRLIENSPDQDQPLPNDLTLSRQLEISRTTLRNAMELLYTKGILRAEQTRKYIVRSPNPNDYFDLSNKPTSKKEVIESYFCQLIHQGKLQPGDHFSELELAKKSGCTTITVREFLIKFSNTGLIQKKPRAQWQMVEFDDVFARELIQFRKLLEINSITALMESSNDDPIWKELQQLLNEHKTLEKTIETDYVKFQLLDARLHKTIQQASNNRFAHQFLEIVTYVCHYHYQWDRHDEKERNIAGTREHIELITNLLARDIHGSIMALEKHLETAKCTLLRSANGLVQ